MVLDSMMKPRSADVAVSIALSSAPLNEEMARLTRK
jgi:hypothetical protein